MVQAVGFDSSSCHLSLTYVGFHVTILTPYQRFIFVRQTEGTASFLINWLYTIAGYLGVFYIRCTKCLVLASVVATCHRVCGCISRIDTFTTHTPLTIATWHAVISWYGLTLPSVRIIAKHITTHVITVATPAVMHVIHAKIRFRTICCLTVVVCTHSWTSEVGCINPGEITTAFTAPGFPNFVIITQAWPVCNNLAAAFPKCYVRILTITKWAIIRCLKSPGISSATLSFAPLSVSTQCRVLWGDTEGTFSDLLIIAVQRTT